MHLAIDLPSLDFMCGRDSPQLPDVADKTNANEILAARGDGVQHLRLHRCSRFIDNDCMKSEIVPYQSIISGRQDEASDAGVPNLAACKSLSSGMKVVVSGLLESRLPSRNRSPQTLYSVSGFSLFHDAFVMRAVPSR